LSGKDGTKSESTTESDLPRIEIDVAKFAIEGTCEMTYINVEADNDQWLTPRFWVACSK
jgi:hypothetical protein